MISYRRSLEQIGVPRDARVAYSDFYCKPKSLSQAMDAMQAAGEFDQVQDIPVDEDWTESVQGCATDGKHWFFTSNKETGKSLYVFDVGTSLRDEAIVGRFRFTSRSTSAPHGAKTGRGRRPSIQSDGMGIPIALDHIGQLDVFEDKIYVSHFKGGDSHVIVLQNNGGSDPTYHGLIPIEVPISPTDGREAGVQFQCIVPWDRTFLTCFGDGVIDVLFVHDLDNGRWTGRTIRLQNPISRDWWVQGAAFSDYGHLFIAVSPDEGDTFPAGRNPVNTHRIHIVSPLNGRELSVFSVCAEGEFEELEGCCFAPMLLPDGRPAELHAVLLDKRLGDGDWVSDNMFFKSFQRIQSDG